MTEILYSDHVVLSTPEGALELSAAAVHVDGGVIQRVQRISRAELPAPEEGVTLVDLGAKLLAPAWVNGHTHLDFDEQKEIIRITSAAGLIAVTVRY